MITILSLSLFVQFYQYLDTLPQLLVHLFLTTTNKVQYSWMLYDFHETGQVILTHFLPSIESLHVKKNFNYLIVELGEINPTSQIIVDPECVATSWRVIADIKPCCEFWDESFVAKVPDLKASSRFVMHEELVPLKQISPS